MSTPHYAQRFAATVARSNAERLERMAATANRIATETQDARWNEAALALLGAQRRFRELLADGDAPATHGSVQ